MESNARIGVAPLQGAKSRVRPMALTRLTVLSLVSIKHTVMASLRPVKWFELR